MYIRTPPPPTDSHVCVGPSFENFQVPPLTPLTHNTLHPSTHPTTLSLHPCPILQPQAPTPLHPSTHSTTLSLHPCPILQSQAPAPPPCPWPFGSPGATHTSEFEYLNNMGYRSLHINSNPFLGIPTTYKTSAMYMSNKLLFSIGDLVWVIL